MIGSDQRLSPSTVQISSKPLSSSLGVKSPRYISDSTTESAANNAQARGYRNKRLQAGKGLSNSAGTRYQQEVQDTMALQKAAMNASNIRLEDQATNAAMKTGYQQQMDAARHNRNMNDASIQSALLGLDKTGWMNLAHGEQKRKQAFKQRLLGGLI
jgi:hypothetical protein